MREMVKFGLYFVLGGLMVSLSSYLGSMGRGFLAAFVSTFPAITGVTIILIYLNGGTDVASTYAKHLLWLVPAWLAYVGILLVAIPRVGFWLSLMLALMIYMLLVAVIRMAIR